jgi:hypothetical protein
VIVQLRVRHPEFLSPRRGLLSIGLPSGGCARRLAAPPAKSFWPLRGEEESPVTLLQCLKFSFFPLAPLVGPRGFWL